MTKFLGILILLFSFFSTVSLGQDEDLQKKIDSMQNVLKSTRNDTTKAWTYVRLVKHYPNEKKEEAIKLALTGYKSSKSKLGQTNNAENKRSLTEALAAQTKFLGNVYAESNDPNAMTSFYNKGIYYSKKVNDIKTEASCLTSLGGYSLTIGDTNQGFTYINNAIKLQKKCNDNDGESRSYRILAGHYRKNGELYLAIEEIKKSIKLLENGGLYSNLVPSCNELGLLYAKVGKFKKAIKLYYKALNISKKNDFKKGEAMSLMNIGQYHSGQSNFVEAIKYTKRGLKINESIQEEYGVAICHNNLGVMYRQAKQYSKSLKSYGKALVLLESWNRKGQAILTKTNMARVYHKMDRPEEAENLFNEALSEANKLGNPMVKKNVLTAFATFELDQGRTDSAHAKALESNEISRQVNNKSALRQSEKLLSDIYEKKGQWKLAYEHFKKYQHLEDSLVNIEAQREIILQESNYKIERIRSKNEYKLLQKEDSLKASQKDSTFKSRMILVISIATGIIVLLSLFWFKTFAQRKKLEEIDLKNKLNYSLKELDLLQSSLKTNSENRSPFKVEILNGNINEFLEKPLSKRELGVMSELLKGKGNQDIANALFVSVNTIRTHLAKIYDKLDVSNRLQAVHKITGVREQNL